MFSRLYQNEKSLKKIEAPQILPSIFICFSTHFHVCRFFRYIIILFLVFAFFASVSFFSHTFLDLSRRKRWNFPSLITYSHIHPHMSPPPRSTRHLSQDVENENMQILISKREKKGYSRSLGFSHPPDELF